MGIRCSLVVMAVLLMTVVTAMAEGIRWVSSGGTSLTAEASATSERVVDVPVGTQVTIVESSGRWLKVKTTAGKVGWVYAGRVSETQPASEVSDGDNGIFGGGMKSSQISTAKADSARSIRGLTPAAAKYAKDRGTPEVYKKALDSVLSRKVTIWELKTFLKAGKIGEYAQVQGGKK